MEKSVENLDKNTYGSILVYVLFEKGFKMKSKLNLTIDQDLVPLSKKYARSRGISISKLVEDLLRKVTQKDNPSFSEKWRGQFKVARKRGPRYDKLKDRFSL